MWAYYPSHTLNADHLVKDLHADCVKAILPAVSEVKTAVCKLCKMTSCHPLLSQALCQARILQML